MTGPVLPPADGPAIPAGFSLLLPPDPDGEVRAAAFGSIASADTVRDLGLDRLLAEWAASMAPRLRTVVSTPLRELEAVQRRQDVFTDLADPFVRGALTRFDDALGRVGRTRQDRSAVRHRLAAQLWGVRVATDYVDAVRSLERDLAQMVSDGRGRSRALRGLADFATGYVAGAAFVALTEQSARVEQLLAQVHYSVWVRGGKVSVAPAGEEPDLQAQVLALFARFGADHTSAAVASRPGATLDHVQEQILDRVAGMFPGTFAAVAELASTVDTHVPDATVWSVREELAFYLTYLRLLEPARAAGLPLCRPVLTDPEVAKDLSATGTWDLSLGLDLAAADAPVVTNDLSLRAPERILVVSGPNQGGKTTTARTFGQLFLLAALGVPVPGRQIGLMLADQVLTVFEHEESAADDQGRLGAELVRLHHVLDAATSSSVVVLNEVFASTPVDDARFLGRRVLDALAAKGTPTVLVTFVDELSRLGPTTVSMVSLVDPHDPTRRTFEVVRRAADGRAYAQALAARHGLDHDQLVARLRR